MDTFCHGSISKGQREKYQKVSFHQNPWASNLGSKTTFKHVQGKKPFEIVYTGELDKDGRRCGIGTVVSSEEPTRRLWGTFFNNNLHGIGRYSSNSFYKFILQRLRPTLGARIGSSMNAWTTSSMAKEPCLFCKYNVMRADRALVIGLRTTCILLGTKSKVKRLIWLSPTIKTAK